MRERFARTCDAGARGLRGAALAAAAALAGACGREFAPAGTGGSAAVRPAAADADREAQRARELEREAARLDAEASSRLHAGDASCAAGDAAAGRDEYIAAGRLYESAAEQRRLASDAADRVRATWRAEGCPHASQDRSDAAR